ncbi:MAG: CHAT domain-containing protein [Theionarchaea archaeon]|nr:CHAT domain-containing protein [Theionarchaea archaeon]
MFLALAGYISYLNLYDCLITDSDRMKDEEKIVKLALEYKNSDIFIDKLEKLFKIPENEKGDFFIEVGDTLYRYSYYVLALHVWNYALNCINESNKERISEIYKNLGICYRRIGDYKKAITYCKKSLKISRKIGDKLGEFKCYGNIGIVYEKFGDFRKAIEYYEKALEIVRDINDRSGESTCYTNLGVAYGKMGDFKKAIEYNKMSLEIKEEINDVLGVLRCCTNLGTAYGNLGNFRKAIEYYEKSLEINKEIGNRTSESKCYTNLSIVYRNLYDFDKAIEYCEKSLAIKRDTHDRSGESICYTNLAIIYRALSNYEKALEYCRKSLEIRKEIKDRSGESTCYTNLGVIYKDLKDMEKALEYHEKSLKIKGEIGEKSGESACYTNIGSVYESLGNPGKAIKYYEQSLKIAEKTGRIESMRIAFFKLSRVHESSNLEAAYNFCKRSIELSEMMRGNLIEEEHKLGFSAHISEAYEHMIPLCVKLERKTDALEYVERSKSRAFLDILAATEITPRCEITTALKSLLDDEERYLARLREIQMQHLRKKRVRVEPEEVEQIYEALNRVYDKIEEFDPEYVFARRGNPLSVDMIQHVLSSQKRDVILVEYFITKEQLYIFVLSKDNQIHIETVPVAAETLNKYLKDWKKIQISLDSQNMSYLVEPISEYVNEGDLIYFVPYGPLHYFPLHALKVDGEPMIQRHPVAYLPHASLMQFFRNKGNSPQESCAAFGVSFEKEAEVVAALFDAKAYLRSLAAKENVLNCKKDIIHLACHGIFDEKDPLSSYILLHEGIITAREIFDARLATNLVTLSGCETGRSRRGPGDELIGLTRAFLYAGVSSVLVSLWPVYGRSTQKLMTEFYTWLRNGADKATALQKAQVTLMETKRFSRPYFWAPFILIGNWK